MSFTNWYYPFFLAAVAILFWMLPRARLAVILAASFVSYSFWDVRFCAMLIAAAASDYVCTHAIEDRPLRPSRIVLAGMLPALWMLLADRIKVIPFVDLVVALLGCVLFCLVALSSTRLERDGRRRVALFLGVGVNLGLLLFFKYVSWFAGGLAILLGRLGMSSDWMVLDVILPLGISFHTFQSISYVVDVYNGRVRAESSFARVLCMIMFFPQLIAGPIERAAHLLPQLRFERRFDWRLLAWGLHLLLLGYFLKIYVADNCAIIVDYFYQQTQRGQPFGPGWALAATLAYAAQIYGDFVGYSYLARGSAILLGVELTRNFELPLLSRSPGEFWHRWHISLSTWIRDYVFLPLSLSLSYRNQSSRTGEPLVNETLVIAVSLIVTMLAAGLWHGASWHFVAFGGFYGVLQVFWIIVPGAKRFSSAPGWWPVLASRSLNFVLVCIAWILFRSSSLGDFARILGDFAGGHASHAPVPQGVINWLALHAVPLVVLIAVVRRDREEADLVRHSRVTLTLSYGLMMVLLASSEASRALFIYFQF